MKEPSFKVPLNKYGALVAYLTVLDEKGEKVTITTTFCYLNFEAKSRVDGFELIIGRAARQLLNDIEIIDLSTEQKDEE